MRRNKQLERAGEGGRDDSVNEDSFVVAFIRMSGDLCGAAWRVTRDTTLAILKVGPWSVVLTSSP
jgi:hypothetical protein